VNELFISVYLDEDVNVLVAELVRLQNFRVLTITEADRKGKSDTEQLEFATENGYMILTRNRVDYEELAQEYFASNQTHGGIVVAVRRPPHEITKRLLKILNNFAAYEIVNQIIYI
jgi:Domain of unknown function (DUF5615)